MTDKRCSRVVIKQWVEVYNVIYDGNRLYVELDNLGGG